MNRDWYRIWSTNILGCIIQEIYYLPRKYVGNDKIMRENILSRFDDAYALEAYIANVDGFQGSGDLMTKFGIRVTDDATFIVSREI